MMQTTNDPAKRTNTTASPSNGPQASREPEDPASRQPGSPKPQTTKQPAAPDQGREGGTGGAQDDQREQGINQQVLGKRKREVGSYADALVGVINFSGKSVISPLLVVPVSAPPVAPEPEKKTQTIQGAQENKAATKDQKQFKQATQIGKREWKKQKVHEHQPPHKMCMHGNGGLTAEERGEQASGWQPSKPPGAPRRHSKKWHRTLTERCNANQYNAKLMAAGTDADATDATNSGLGLGGGSGRTGTKAE